MEYQSHYEQLVKEGTKLDNILIDEKKKKALEYFKTKVLISTTNIENNMLKSYEVYSSLVKSIHGTSMVCYSNEYYAIIFIDEEIYKTNSPLMHLQLQHEVLHGLSSGIDNLSYRFGHITTTNDIVFRGINEAATQMFAEDIYGFRLSKKDNYLHYIVNIMRILKVLYGSEIIANQYFNGDTSFEDNINEQTDYGFQEFASNINRIYRISQKEFYKDITEDEKKEKEHLENSINEFVSSLISKSNDLDINTKILEEIDEEFHTQYNNKIKPVTIKSIVL